MTQLAGIGTPYALPNVLYTIRRSCSMNLVADAMSCQPLSLPVTCLTPPRRGVLAEAAAEEVAAVAAAAATGRVDSEDPGSPTALEVSP